LFDEKLSYAFAASVDSLFNELEFIFFNRPGKLKQTPSFGLDEDARDRAKSSTPALLFVWKTADLLLQLALDVLCHKIFLT